jgi:hypothetical protein
MTAPRIDKRTEPHSTLRFHWNLATANGSQLHPNAAPLSAQGAYASVPEDVLQIPEARYSMQRSEDIFRVDRSRMWGFQGRSQGFRIDGAEKLEAQGIFLLKQGTLCSAENPRSLL